MSKICCGKCKPIKLDIDKELLSYALSDAQEYTDQKSQLEYAYYRGHTDALEMIEALIRNRNE